MIEKRSASIHYQTILKWVSRMFLIISILFALILVPLFAKMYDNISELEASKRNQLLHNGTNKISSTVTGILNISNALQNDNNFGKLRYKNINNISIPVTTQNQMKKNFQNMILPYDSISHIALQYDEKTVITDETVFFDNMLDYYPTFFQVNDFDYNQWTDYLSSVGTGFTEVCHIKVPSSEYDALIFVIPWVNTTYLYACIDVANIKEQIMEEDNINDCYFTIESADKRVLYTDLPEKISKYKTISEVSPAGKIKLSVHILNTFYKKSMKSFYVTLAIYLVVCIIFFILVNIIGTRRISKPIKNIINILEQSKNLKSNHLWLHNNSVQGFDYISSIIINADKNIEKYQDTLSTQQKIIQARFFEKAINGQLVSENDIQNFNASFSNFPDDFCLVLIRFWTYTHKYSASIYKEPLLLIQSFLQTELSVIYQQQISNTELLLLFSKSGYENSRQTLEFLVGNVNMEEPTYHICCIASDVYNSFNNLSAAYQQLRSMDGLLFDDYQTHICVASDSVKNCKSTISMIDIMTLYTAVTSGNSELALNKLSSFSKELISEDNVSFAMPVYDIIRSMLLYIKVNYPQALIEKHIPNYEIGVDLYDQLHEIIKEFCDLISENTGACNGDFSHELLNYIDEHYTDPDVCLTTLKTVFKCSESTVRKAFKQITDVPIARYIEQKRMLLANELLKKSCKNVAEIASECGYTLPHSFYKAYKRVYGHAPTVKDNYYGDFYE